MATFINFKKEDMKLLLESGLAIAEPKSKYEVMRMKGAIVAILFTSGKLLLQGQDELVNKFKRILHASGFKEETKPDFVKEEGVYIGSDECLKGDTFGGLVVAGVRADDVQRENLKILGVMDSKKLTDYQIPNLAKEIYRLAKVAVRNIYPDEYNKHSQTELLNKLHRDVAKELGAGTHVVDKYPGCNVGDIMTTKAESKYVEVAAASIIARDEGLKQLRALSSQLGIDVPKGSTHVKDALDYLKKSKKDPRYFVKLHFSNVSQMLEE
jgi:ribonuclease HIII